MPRFRYTAKDNTGSSQKGFVEALTINQALNMLHERGMTIIDLKEIIQPISINIGHSGISFSDLVYFTRQLSTMITAGLTLIEALGVLKQQTSKQALLKLISQIESDIQGGKSFTDVLEKHPNVFPPIYRALVRAGEASGKLDTILSRLADNLEKSKDFRSKIRGALIYPAIIVIGMVIVATIVMIVVIPRMTSMYQEFGVELPLPTQILIAISNFMVNFWYILLAGIIAGTVGFLKFRQTRIGRFFFAEVSLNLPIFGPLIKESTLVEVTRTLSMLIEGGVPILTSLEIAQNATSNILYQEAFINAAKKVEKGFPLSEPLESSKLFPPILGQMVTVGEQTGKLGDSLLKLSRYFETEAESAVRTLTTMIEPLIMVVLGLGVGFLVMAVLLPIYSLTSKF